MPHSWSGALHRTDGLAILARLRTKTRTTRITFDVLDDWGNEVFSTVQTPIDHRINRPRGVVLVGPDGTAVALRRQGKFLVLPDLPVDFWSPETLPPAPSVWPYKSTHKAATWGDKEADEALGVLWKPARAHPVRAEDWMKAPASSIWFDSLTRPDRLLQQRKEALRKAMLGFWDKIVCEPGKGLAFCYHPHTDKVVAHPYFPSSPSNPTPHLFHWKGSRDGWDRFERVAQMLFPGRLSHNHTWQYGFGKLPPLAKIEIFPFVHIAKPTDAPTRHAILSARAQVAQEWPDITPLLA